MALITEENKELKGYYSDGLAPKCANNGKYGYIDKNNNEVIPCIYDDANAFYDGLAVVKKDEKYGIIDKNNNIVIDFNYDKLGLFFSDGFNTAKRGKKTGVINESGKIVISFLYDEIKYLGNGIFGVKIADRWGYCNSLGKHITECVYDSVGAFFNDFAVVRKNGKAGVLDKTKGEQVLDCEYDDITILNGDFIKLVDNKECGLVNFKHNVFIPCEYDSLFIDNGLIFVKQYERWGVLDTTGEQIYPCIFKDIKSLQSGRTAVKIKNKWGLLANDTAEVIDIDLGKTKSIIKKKSQNYKVTSTTKVRAFLEKNINAIKNKISDIFTSIDVYCVRMDRKMPALEKIKNFDEKLESLSLDIKSKIDESNNETRKI